jgi:hypothetical protein
MEDDHNILENGRRPKFFRKWKMNLFFCQLKTQTNSLQKKMQPETLKIKTMVVAPLLVT